MPNSPSAKKRLRQSVVRRDRNKSIKSSVRTQIRKLREAVAAGNNDEAKTMMPLTCKKIDQAASKGAIHRNRAARLKSRLSKLLVGSSS